MAASARGISPRMRVKIKIPITVEAVTSCALLYSRVRRPSLLLVLVLIPSHSHVHEGALILQAAYRIALPVPAMAIERFNPFQ